VTDQSKRADADLKKVLHEMTGPERDGARKLAMWARGQKGRLQHREIVRMLLRAERA